LDIDFVNQMENAESGCNLSESLIFYIGVTILHEAVHYGDFNYNNYYYQPPGPEEGYLFQNQVYGGDIYIDLEGNIRIE